jgi:serine/threonine protein kinase
VDVGFLPLKKYCSILFGYCNKGQYTAPELLLEKGSVVSNPTQAGDIYAFGMIVYEFFSGKPPFKVGRKIIYCRMPI